VDVWLAVKIKDSRLDESLELSFGVRI